MNMKKDKQNPNDGDLVFEEETANDSFATTDAIKKLRAKLKTAEEEKRENLLGWQRAKADYSNLKAEVERKQKEFAGLVRAGLIEDFLPLADSFELAMADQEAWEAVPANWRKGVEYIYNQLEKILEGAGVAVINPLGQTFNPGEHEAVGTIETEQEKDDHQVLVVTKKGYRLEEKLIRPAQVKIGHFKNKEDD